LKQIVTYFLLLEVNTENLWTQPNKITGKHWILVCKKIKPNWAPIFKGYLPLKISMYKLKEQSLWTVQLLKDYQQLTPSNFSIMIKLSESRVQENHAPQPKPKIYQAFSWVDHTLKVFLDRVLNHQITNYSAWMKSLIHTKAVRTDRSTKIFIIQRLQLSIKIKLKVLYNKISFLKINLDQTGKVSWLSPEHLQFLHQDKTWFLDSK